MKRFIQLLAVIALSMAAEHTRAQVLPGGPANIAGTLYASNFAQWSVPMGNNGPLSWSYPSACNSQTSGGVTFKPFVVGSPIHIVDVNPSQSETVTVTSVRPAGAGCQIQVNPSNPHDSFTLQSATAGLQEAINFAGLQNYLIYTTPDFTRLGGTTSTITNAKGSTVVPILDFRTQVPVPYSWNGTNYVAGTIGGGVQLTGPVTTPSPTSGATTITPTGVGTGCYTLGSLSTCVNAAGQIISIGNPFAFSLNCGFLSGYEIGFSLANPACAFNSYSGGTPVSATLSDGTNTVNLTSPYSSATLSYTYTANATFTGSATSATSQTATSSNQFTVLPCTFSGLTSGGTASGVTASGSGSGNQCASETAVLAGVTGTLSSNGLGTTFSGQSFTFASPGGSNISLILTGGCGHTLSIGGFVTIFNTFAVNYTNILGASQTGMCVYTSPQPASISTTVVVQSL